MKYKDFKILTKDDMKKIKGGDEPGGGTCTCLYVGDWFGCVATCTGWGWNCVSNGHGPICSHP